MGREGDRETETKCCRQGPDDDDPHPTLPYRSVVPRRASLVRRAGGGASLSHGRPGEGSVRQSTMKPNSLEPISIRTCNGSITMNPI